MAAATVAAMAAIPTYRETPVQWALWPCSLKSFGQEQMSNEKPGGKVFGVELFLVPAADDAVRQPAEEPEEDDAQQ